MANLADISHLNYNTEYFFIFYFAMKSLLQPSMVKNTRLLRKANLFNKFRAGDHCVDEKAQVTDTIQLCLTQ